MKKSLVALVDCSALIISIIPKPRLVPDPLLKVTLNFYFSIFDLESLCKISSRAVVKYYC